MNQNSWPAQVYWFARHTHREHEIPPPRPLSPQPTASRFPIPSQVGSILQTSLRTADAFPVVDDRKCVCCSQTSSRPIFQENPRNDTDLFLVS